MNRSIPPAVTLGPWQKRILYTATTLLWISGSLWLYDKYFGQIRGEFGLQAPPMQPVLLEIHGAVAMAFLIIFGTVLHHHVPTGWQQKRQRPSGVLLVASCGILILTGWGLYYLGGASLRHWTSLIHAVLGLALPALVFLHVWLGKRTA